MEAPDEELMLAYRGGDAGAFETLYKRHRGALYRFVLRAIKQRPAAEELFQEVWIRVIEARNRYAPRARFTTWLYTIAHNLLVDHWRRKGLTLVQLDEENHVASPDNPARQAEARESLARLVQAIEALPAAHVDEAILAAARRAAETRPAPLVVPSGRRRWYFPLAAAAVIVLAVAVTVQVERQQPDPEIAVPPVTEPKVPT